MMSVDPIPQREIFAVPDESPDHLIRFGLFEVDVRARELRKQGAKIKLQEQPFRVLVALLRNPGEVVTREELRQELWPADTFVDFEHSLNAAVKRLRDALGESADTPVYVETLARRGYRFIAPVEAVANDEPSEVAATNVVVPRRHSIGWLGIAALTALAAASLLLLARSRGWGAAARDSSINSLAVLPLENLSGDPEQQYFSDGMTDALIAQLSKATSLRVTSRTSVMRYKGTKESLQDIANELNVDGVVEGTVMRSGNRVRIMVTLVRARNDQHVWAESYERDLSDVMKLQADVAQAVSQQVRAQVSSVRPNRSGSATTVDPEAYETYLKGTYNRLQGNLASLKEAQAYFNEAIRRDPSFALAYVGLAGSYLDLGIDRWMAPREAYRKGSEAIHKALELDESIGEAHVEQGYLEWQYGWDWHDAEKEIRHGVEINPRDVSGHETLAWFLAWSRRSDEALAEVQKIGELDPVFPNLFTDYAGIYYHQRNYKSLVEAARKSIGADPNAWSAHYFLAVGYEGLNQLPEAVAEYERAVDLSQRDTDTLAGLAHVCARSDRAAESKSILIEMQRRSKENYISPYMIAVVYAALGDKDNAFQYLEKAYEQRSPDLAYFVKADLRMDALRRDPRFQKVVDRVSPPQ